MVELLDRGRVARVPRDYILVSTIRGITIVICYSESWDNERSTRSLSREDLNGSSN